MLYELVIFSVNSRVPAVAFAVAKCLIKALDSRFGDSVLRPDHAHHSPFKLLPGMSSHECLLCSLLAIRLPQNTAIKVDYLSLQNKMGSPE